MPNVFDAYIKNKNLRTEIHNTIEQYTRTGSWCFNVKTAEFLCSDNCKKLLGLKKQDPIIEDDIAAILIEPDREKFKRWLKQLNEQNNQRLTVQLAKTENTACELSFIVSGYDKEESIHFGIIQQSDNSLAEQTSQATLIATLEKQTTFIQKITSTVPDMLSIINLPTRAIRFINDEEFRLHGFDPDEMHKSITTKLQYLVHPDDRKVLDDYYNKMVSASDEDIITADYRAKGNYADWAWFHVRGKVFTRNENGGVEDILNVIQNITESKINRQKLDQLNKKLEIKNRELESLASELQTFTSIAATDFREPLQNVYTALEFIVNGEAATLSNNGRANLRRAQSALQKLNLLTEDIIAYSSVRNEEPVLNDVNLNAVIRLVLYDLRVPITNSAAVIEYKELPVVKGDALQLHLLFNHIISNAVKFRKETEVPTIYIEEEVKEANTENGVRINTYIRIRDNGIGFEQPEAERIFNIFVKLHDKKYKGSGTGLAICKKIMELHGGSIKAYSKPGEGTTIECCFPMY